MPGKTIQINSVRDAIRENRYLIKHHARRRRRERGYSTEDIENVLLTGDVVELYNNARPHPKCLVMKHIEDEPVYVSVAYDSTKHYAYIITIHGYDPQKWIDPWTRRRR